MELEMQNGNLYADKQKFQKQVHEQLNRGYAEEVVTEVEVYKVMYQMVHDKALYYEDGALYSAKLYHFETQAAKDLATLLVQTYMPPAGLEDLITQAQGFEAVIVRQAGGSSKEGIHKSGEYYHRRSRHR